MKHEELRKKNLEELRKMASDLEKKIADEYFDMRMGKEKDVRKPRNLRRELAILMTIIKEKELVKLNDKSSNVGEDKTNGDSKKQ